jgi:hypothetical protein
VALLGGTTQLILKLLIDATGSAYAPPWYVIVALAIGMLALTQLRDAPGAAAPGGADSPDVDTPRVDAPGDAKVAG